ncbi:MAG: methyl viologen-reducing hydrogenase [Deltaproteobacteria bacterium CG2_30_63_29]|nr:MAG: methyl viologen-reducing hydrogenase [Deltaproteobacteria bacterium CG2_30_63_29]PJB43415.1 MAG: methyl viologen-reducing hydrogenase [Deltaproteobacteria bacterium CG_4_9_14_3_um_filter_63_12]
MGAEKATLNTDWLSACGGCHVALVDLHEKILDVIGAVNIQHCPVLTDIKGYPKADIGILTGAVRNEHDRHAAEAMRASCDVVIAFGTCAVYGGLTGASLAHCREEILDRVYVNNKTTLTHEAPTSQVALLEKLVTPIDEVIDVDLYLPGCPPHASFIFEALSSLLEKRPPEASDRSVCARCRRKMVKTDVSAIKANHEGMPDAETCFLSQGYVCLGSVTLDRCHSACTNQGIPCTGCAGPTLQVLTEPTHDLRTEVSERMSKLTAIPYADLMAAMERAAKTHYAYAMATKMIGDKPTFLINKWIEDVEAEDESNDHH